MKKRWACEQMKKAWSDVSSQTYISDRTSKMATPSPRSWIFVGGDPESVGKVPKKSIMAVYLASSPMVAILNNPRLGQI